MTELEKRKKKQLKKMVEQKAKIEAIKGIIENRSYDATRRWRFIVE